MSAQQLNELWNLVRENEKNIALLKQQLGTKSVELEKLKADNEAMHAILNQAIGAKTVFSIIGATIVAIVTWAITYYTGRR